MYRINPETGEVLVPHLFEDGTYGAADPKFGKTRHHITNRVIAANIDVLREYFREGWPIWMSIRGTRDRRLISNGITNAYPPSAGPTSYKVPQAEFAATQPRVRIVEQNPKSLVHVVPAAAPVTVGVTEYLRILASMTPVEVAAEIDNPLRLLMGTCFHKVEAH